MTATTITYRPCTVRVSDERGTVAGALVEVTTDNGVMSGRVIPPEGDSRDCWLPSDLCDLDREVIDQIGIAAREGAAGRSGTVEC